MSGTDDPGFRSLRSLHPRADRDGLSGLVLDSVLVHCRVVLQLSEILNFKARSRHMDVADIAQQGT